MRIGIYGGTFDPVHIGHVNLVKELQNVLHLNQILVIPTHVSPFKTESLPLARGSDRLEMLRLAFESVKHVVVSDMELVRGDVSYTIDTVHEVYEMYPHAEVYLLLTEEVWQGFSHWRSSALLKGLVKPIIATKRRKGGKDCVKIPWIDISSREIREKLSKGEDCSSFLSPKVLDYIHQHQLYSPT